ncbi:hypothetical protein DM01DRAFT_1334024 [Hesseltinella vesiculosa]|uniref:Uncharacterized protein n=1 Tax=Hesseltinella vesiculosa TaxID=101127 RepID=A0A1X2GMJ3_9FUNG|nr:hypothetical protein DM01DRAFT_1334024 [Hesseltinella vesiculosa]
MSDLAWCTHCDKAISQFLQESLYCSEQCLRNDALKNHPLLGYTYPEFVDFPRPHGKHTPTTTLPASVAMTTTSSRSSVCSTVPTLSTSHSTEPVSPTLSSTSTDTDVDQLDLSSKSLHPPSCLLLGPSTPTIALTRDLVFGF